MGLTETASRLIAKHGQAAEVLRPGPGTTDEFGGYTPGPDTAYTCKAVLAEFTVNAEYIAAGLLDVGDVRVLVSAEGLAITPETTDRINIDGEVLRIKRVVRHAPGGILFFYELQGADFV